MKDFEPNKIHSGYSGNCEAETSEFLENLKEKYLRHLQQSVNAFVITSNKQLLRGAHHSQIDRYIRLFNDAIGWP